MIPYGRQTIDDDDIQAVVDTLRSDWLTTGPKVDEFEQEFSRFTDSDHAVAVSNGTAALHTALHGAGITTDDEVIVPSLTFVATANAALYQGARPVFAEVESDTLVLDPVDVAERITKRTKAIVTVDFGGNPSRYAELRELADDHGLTLIADACHALGATYHDRPVGSLADLTVFSFHPVKHITTGEGGMVTTHDESVAGRMRRFRHHGLDDPPSHLKRFSGGSKVMVQAGTNYRLSDLQCALGITQLAKMPDWLDRRRAIAAKYDAAFDGSPHIVPQKTIPNSAHSYHLYVVRVDGVERQSVLDHLTSEGVTAAVHYLPVHLHPYYEEALGMGPGRLPTTERAGSQVLTLPVYPTLTDQEADHVIRSIDPFV